MPFQGDIGHMYTLTASRNEKIMMYTPSITPNSKMAVARDDLRRAARKRGIEGQVTTIRNFEIRCIG